MEMHRAVMDLAEGIAAFVDQEGHLPVSIEDVIDGGYLPGNGLQQGNDGTWFPNHDVGDPCQIAIRYLGDYGKEIDIMVWGEASWGPLRSNISYMDFSGEFYFGLTGTERQLLSKQVEEVLSTRDGQ